MLKLMLQANANAQTNELMQQLMKQNFSIWSKWTRQGGLMKSWFTSQSRVQRCFVLRYFSFETNCWKFALLQEISTKNHDVQVSFGPFGFKGVSLCGSFLLRQLCWKTCIVAGNFNQEIMMCKSVLALLGSNFFFLRFFSFSRKFQPRNHDFQGLNFEASISHIKRMKLDTSCSSVHHFKIFASSISNCEKPLVLLLDPCSQDIYTKYLEDIYKCLLAES